LYAVELDSFLMGKMVCLYVFHNRAIMLAMWLGYPWIFLNNLSIDMAQELSDIIHPRGNAPLYSIGFL